MSTIRVLHVDDEADIREIVELSLRLDTALQTRSCGSGKEAISVAAEWEPDIILLDVMMPVMDGPATFRKLQEDARTAHIPVVFMTARAQSREVDEFRAIGGAGVIPKPFDPMTLAPTLCRYLPRVQDPFDDLRAAFLTRVKRDAAALLQNRTAMRQGSRSPDTLRRIQHLAHSLAGAGGIYGFIDVSNGAAALEDAILAETAGSGNVCETDRALDGLILLADNCKEADAPPMGTAPPASRSPPHFHGGNS